MFRGNNADGGGKQQPLVGAKEKRMQALLAKAERDAKANASGNQGNGQKGDGPKKNAAPAAVLILVLSCFLSYLLTDGPWKSNVPFKSGHDGLDALAFSVSPASVTGDHSLDVAFQIFFRGIVIWLVAGFLPFMALLWQKGLDKSHLNPWRTMWGVSVGIFAVYYGLVAMGPTFEALFKGF